MKHKCRVCGLIKNVNDFVKHISNAPLESWNLRFCKECSHEKFVSRYADKRAKEAMLCASRNWKQQNPERHAELAREYRKKYPEKTMAQNRLNYAIRCGKIKRGNCEVCGTNKKVHAHHVSYAPKDWYNVRWLCFLCHKLEHHK